ncbi:hypothetical protein BHE74_00007847 [Ensete ventricosum]|nr:hypothetical protein GW17_00011317 [Ensete ventricosum]RWW83636.1 hypothetical protein BHE74_00007847 [Ensete ventricosum]RZR84025.1 hypothetical protein BHM03_00010771 [Ensete ventricosum]
METKACRPSDAPSLQSEPFNLRPTVRRPNPRRSAGCCPSNPTVPARNSVSQLTYAPFRLYKSHSFFIASLEPPPLIGLKSSVSISHFVGDC